MRIEEHPILSFKNEKKIKFYFNGKEYEGFEGDTIASSSSRSRCKGFEA